MKYFSLFSLIALLLCSCAKDESENVNQDSIYTIYEIVYNKNTDKTIVTATFRFGGAGGTLLQLTAPASVTFNGDVLLYNSVLGLYSKEYAGKVPSGTYVYTDLDNNVYTNITPQMVDIMIPATDTINAANAFTFSWMGANLGPNETITLTIDGTQQGNAEIFSTIIQGSTSLILSASRLQNLGLGQATLYLTRAINIFSVSQGTSEGGRIAVKYSDQGSSYIKQ